MSDDVDNVHKRAADDLCEVMFAMADVDLNALMDDDVRTLLEYKQDLSEMCRRYRQDQYAAKRNADDVAGALEAGEEADR